MLSKLGWFVGPFSEAILSQKSKNDGVWSLLKSDPFRVNVLIVNV
jgi:hypothetical protein